MNVLFGFTCGKFEQSTFGWATCGEESVRLEEFIPAMAEVELKNNPAKQIRVALTRARLRMKFFMGPLMTSAIHAA